MWREHSALVPGGRAYAEAEVDGDASVHAQQALAGKP